jgi:GNAT superfamily N-acetyltransferase
MAAAAPAERQADSRNTPFKRESPQKCGLSVVVRDMKLAKFVGVTTPVEDLIIAIQNQGWQLGQVQFDNKLNSYAATAISPHGEQLQKTGPDPNTAVANALLAVTRRNHMRTTAQFKVGMWRTNWHERLPEIAEAYRDAPIYDPKAVAAWKALGDDSMHRLHVLGGQLHIEPTNDPAPYKSADDMRKDVHEKRHYYLSQAGTSHPVWTSDQVAAFRAVHDILGHGVAGGHYDWPGRNLAAAAHMPLLEPLAQQALFAETVGRQAALQTYGHMPQKITLFPDFVDHHQSINQGGAHRGIHPSQTTAPVAIPKPFALDGAFASLGKTAQEANTIDVNKGWTSGVDPLPVNAFAHHGDPMEYKKTLDNAALVDTGWSQFKRGDGSDDRERMKLAIVNAFRVVLLSPRKDLRWNAIHYQDISNIPGSVDDPKVYWDTLESARRKWNSAQGIDPNSHMIYFKFLKPFEARIAAQHPEKGWEWAKEEAKQTLFNWWTEEQERIQAEDSTKPPEKQRGADEIERRANEALAKRLQLFLKPKDEKTDVEDTQMSMFGSDEMKKRYADLFSASPGMEPKITLEQQDPTRLSESLRDDFGDIPVASAKDYVAHHNGQEVGRLSMGVIHRHGRPSPFVSHIEVHPDYRHQGIGSMLAQRMIADHGSAGYTGGFTDEGERFWPNHGDFQSLPFLESKVGAPQYNLLTGEESLKYGAFMGTHLKSISQISQHADDILDAALEDVREHDATGHHFRHQVLALNVPGVGPKVCSFAWLMLQPLTSQLATMDVHMMDVLGHNYEKEMNNRDYFKFEREFRAGLDAAGYGHMPLGAAQWGMWDYKRTGPGTHQDHSAMRVLDPKPHNEINWAAKSQPVGGDLATNFKKNWADSVDWWAATKPYRDQVGQEWDNTYGKNFPRGVVPYQDMGQHVAKIAYGTDFDHFWDRLMPVGSAIESKARSAAEYAKADHKTHDELEDWLNDHKSDTRLSDIEFKRFKKLVLKKWDRISKVAAVEPTPSFKHPETGEVHQGVPGQSLMEHARLSLGLSTQDVWRRLADEHVQKA